ncbi:Dolichyl-phosphate-mannose-protein mannosyltransferase-domain-containing protein [Mortierella sp. GBAus27b]|nr:Dolichyl-phosphate-mannose-protein mannosyltransferase-domain-containing protein [Mortierella sp. GBAus27b]
MAGIDSGDDRYSSKHSNKKKGHPSGRSSQGIGVKDIFNDWDLLLPSTDAYADDEDDIDDELNEDEKRKKRQLVKKGWESSRGQAILLTLLVLMAIIVRIWKLAVPGAVVFDEQHFGGFAADYLKGEFFMDIHPPLGKMLYAGVAYMLGFDGQFDFVPGRLYTKNVPYIGMRMFAVACGVGLIPVSYLTIKRSGHSTQAAMICAVFVTFENALVTQSRFILLDAPMMLFMSYTILAWINFYNHRNRPFTRGWWFWLLQTGFSLFLSSSVKWVGLFTITTVGVCVLKYLQHLYISTRDFSKQFVALFICLLVLPGVLYLGLHALDFRLLSLSGSGNAWVSPQFQMTLKGHDVLPVMADVAWDSKVHIRHANTNGGWVHTMPGEYTREESKDQAIQLVEWDDELTCWQVYPGDPKVRQQYNQHKQALKINPHLPFDGYVYEGDKIRLRHCYSKMALATNDMASLGSNKTFLREVRGIKWSKQIVEDAIWVVELVPEGLVPGLADHYGNMKKDTVQPTGVPVNDRFHKKVMDKELKDDTPGKETTGQVENKRDQSKQWHSIKGFRLWNEKQQCYLQSHKVFRSSYSTYQEVACVQGGRQKANTIFIVDQNVNSYLPKSTPSLSYQPLSFFQKFMELNRVMWWTHHDLSAPVHGDDHSSDSSKAATDESRPWSWPLMKRGMNYYSSKETNHYVHFMGNPLLWWTASGAVALYMLSCSWNGFLTRSHSTLESIGITPFYSVASGTFYAGWAIHYLPFFFMSRQVFLHHYLPALYFSILLLVSRLDRTWQRWPARARYLTGMALMASVIVSWYCFSPLAYGTDFGSQTRCEQLRQLGRWSFTCTRQDLAWARSNEAGTGKAAQQQVGEEDDEDDPNENRYYDWSTDDHSQLKMEGDIEEPNQPLTQEQPPQQEQRQRQLDETSRAEADERLKRMTAAAESRAKEMQEKQQLIADKEALEQKKRELEERLQAHERELEEQRQLLQQREREEQERQGK